jgi:rhamnose utilization protein RhaD (predicted bifunctional aldolase and dehydrogenase)/NAD(P)-dependent dehydrogenase (short-subunit alcohol dehydrogenase family)
MESRWSDREAAEYVDRFAPAAGEQLALRVYTSRLIGRDPALVMHGGGNTSLKGTVKTLVGDEVEALFVKGSGWDLDAIEPPGLPAVDLAHLRRLRTLRDLSDEEMVNQLRTHLFEAGAPTPSVETLLHVFLPHRFIDHTHADIALVLTNQPRAEAEAMVRDGFGARWAVVPYVMPGFALAKLAAEVYEKDPSVEGLVLLNHGLFTFADDARTAYERMIAGVDRAEKFVAKRAKAPTTVAMPGEATRLRAAMRILHESRVGLDAAIDDEGGAARSALEDALDVTRAATSRLAPALRGALAEPVGGGTTPGDRMWRRWVIEHRTSDAVLAALARPDAADLAVRGPLTPDHVIRTKGPGLFLDGLPEDETGLRRALDDAIARYRAAYDDYFEANKSRGRGKVTKLDTLPRVMLVPGVGILAAGRTKKDARIAADIAEHTVVAKATANDVGRYTALSDADLFDMEYWSLEQAKLGKAKEPALAGQVALVTGAAGAIGFGICKKLIEAGAHVAVSDMDEARVRDTVKDLDPKGAGVALPLVMDVTDEGSVAAGFGELCRVYGGLDVLVLNAGIAHVSPIADTDPAAFRKVVDVNLVGYFLVLRQAIAILKRQGTGGNVIVNSSKNVFAPGADFGAYSASKAGAHQLGKVAALELAASGVRVNMVNADAVFGDGRRPSGLWQEVGPARAKSRGLDPEKLQTYYRDRNLLKATITPEHVGNAVVFFASNLTPTTGATLPVDGGVVDAFPR